MNTINTELSELDQTYTVLKLFRIEQESDLDFVQLELQLRSVYRSSYNENERVVFVITGDCYNSQSPAGIGLQSIQTLINVVDISNYFVEILTTNPDIHSEYQWIMNNVSQDSVPFHITLCSGQFQRWTNSKIRKFIKKEQLQNHSLEFAQLTEYHQALLSSKTFCIFPWTHLQIEPNGRVRTCCESKEILGNVNHQSLEEIWNSDPLKKIRKSMLSDQHVSACSACYKKENLQRESMRISFNRQLMHRMSRVDQTDSDGGVDYFSLNYIDSRFNNLCNLSCRSCDSTYSSAWHDVAVTLGLKDRSQRPLLVAGKTPTDVFDQIIQHIDDLDIIYFAGGEPLINEQFYDILYLLIDRKRFQTKLLYNTNLTQLTFKKQSIVDIWKQFQYVSVGASLDGEGARAEYLRPGTKWNQIVNNRRLMLAECPNVDFYISATTGMINALHVPDFHKSWVDQGLIDAENFNIQILFAPEYQSIEHAPDRLKQAIVTKYQDHLTWLRPLDQMGRATVGYESIIELIKQSRSQFEFANFWQKVTELDQYHQTNLLDFFPELAPFVAVDQK